jgi:hypothetical protein
MPTSRKKSHSAMLSSQALRRLAANLKPPSSLLPPIAADSRALKKVVSQRPARKSAIQAALDKITSRPTPFTPSVFLPVGLFGKYISPWQYSFHPTVPDVYLPQDTPAPPPPAKSANYSFVSTTSNDPSGLSALGSANLVTGTISPYVDLTTISQAHAIAWAGVFCSITTDSNAYGKHAAMLLDPKINWSLFMEEYVEPSWYSLTSAGPNEGLSLRASLWSIAYSNGVTLAQNQKVIFDHFWESAGAYSQSPSGTLDFGSLTISFPIAHGETYIVGVWAEVCVSQNFSAAEQGGVLPPPNLGQLEGYANFIVTVPEMWISYSIVPPY